MSIGHIMKRVLRSLAAGLASAINVGAKTHERYGELVGAHVKPHIGGLLIQKLQPVHLAELYAKLLREGNRQRGLDKVTGLAARTVGHVHRAIHKALKVAVESAIVQRMSPTWLDHRRWTTRNWKFFR